MTTPLISVLLPFRDASDTLGESLESLRAQTCGGFEALLFDDGSTDESLAIAQSVARADARFRVVDSERVGIVEALRRLGEAAAGTYVARMDADDVAEPSRLDEQVRFLEAHPEAGICGTGVQGFGAALGPGRRRYEAWLNNVHEGDALRRELFVECPLAHPTFMMRRAAFKAAGGYEDRGWAEDYDLVMRLWLAGWGLGKVPAPLLRWRHRPGRLSLRDERYSLAQFRALKRHYLFRSYLADRDAFYQWGAGEVGKAWLREWDGRKPLAAVDINPRKFGKVIHEVPVIAPDGLPEPGEMFVVVAVGAPGARAEIRDWFGRRGYVELRDYLFVA